MGKKRKARVSSDDFKAMPEEGSGADETLAPKEKSLYEILCVERSASQQEIKKAYYKLALRLHPDKNPGDDEAKEKFQILQRVISILGDEEKRALYDQTGLILFGNGADNLQEYFRSIYKKVTEADVEEFEANYRGSGTEKADLKNLYTKYVGNMDRLFCYMICSYPDQDSHRFKDIIDEAINEGELKPTKSYQKWAKKISAIKPPSDPLSKKTRSKKKAETDLVALISQRQSSRKEQFDSVLSSIMAKHDPCGGPEPSEEEFQAASQRLKNKNNKSKGRKR